MGSERVDCNLALAAFLEENYGMLYWSAAKLFQSREDIEDCIQTVALRYLEHFEETKAASPQRLTAYFITMMRNYALDAKKKKRLSVVPIEDEASVASPLDIEERYLASYDAAIIRQCMNELGQSDRTILEMKYFLDLSNGEIAKMLHIRTDSVRTYLHRARQRLKAVLLEHGYDPIE